MLRHKMCLSKYTHTQYALNIQYMYVCALNITTVDYNPCFPIYSWSVFIIEEYKWKVR